MRVAAVALTLGPLCPALLAPAQQWQPSYPPPIHAPNASAESESTPPRPVSSPLRPMPEGIGSSAAWQPLGPVGVNTPNFGLVTGRVSAIALDPADPTGNRVYIGTTGGGVWLSQNAATSDPSNIRFVPLTDAVSSLATAIGASTTIGAISIQPGGTGVVLAGTGDPNDALDSYYGPGLLRSTDGGNTWHLIQLTSDLRWTFIGEAFSGFAWSTLNQQLVVAAVSQALEASLSGATQANVSYQGLYYSTDSGATWSLATITDGGGNDVQGPTDLFAQPDGNAATSVVWNPVRKLFIAAIRYHGYYQSADGETWTRLGAQPGTGLTMANCITNQGNVGSTACPIFRGTLAVNPQTGDTFAWTVDVHNQDQGIWQDQCAISAGVCTNPVISFGRQWSTALLDVNDSTYGPETIENGDYNLALAAIPSGSDTLLLAGANDLWKCSLAAGCSWRNTTNATSCKAAHVSPYHHALVWNPYRPGELFIGNDGGLWRSLDAADAAGDCSADDATHFQNLNSGLGSLAEVSSLSAVIESPYTLMVGLGVNGTAGVKGTSGPTSDWPQILGAIGGPVAIDPATPSNWYVNDAPGVSVHVCAQSSECAASDFGAQPAVNNADVAGDGAAMTVPAPILVDSLDSSQLLIGTCRVWRGPANGSGWNSSNAISPFLDGATGKSACNADSLIRSMAAVALAGGSEMIYAGMYGLVDGGRTRAGHIFKAVFNPSTDPAPAWHDLTSNPVTNDTASLNAFAYDISSIYIDPHDPTGNTVYVTVAGLPKVGANARVVYGSTDGGAHWQILVSNLPFAPANSIVVDPQDANTVYIALDIGVYSTRRIASCLTGPGNCWSAFGTGLPLSPVTKLSAAPASVSPNVLVAATYGRGVWQIPLWSAGAQITTAQLSTSSLAFATQTVGSTSGAQSITVTNTGGIGLDISSIAATGDFSETDNCQGSEIGAGSSCVIQVVFTPAQSGARGGQLTIESNISGGQLAVSLSGTGADPTGVVLSPSTVNFGSVVVGLTSSPLQITVRNPTASSVAVTSIGASAPFNLSANACGASLAANSDCQLLITFSPTQSGTAHGTLTLSDAAGTQTAVLTGSGAAPPTDTLSASALAFPSTIVGQVSSPQTVGLVNSGGAPLESIAASASGPFQVTSNCTTQLAANAGCTFSVLFQPSTPGPQTGLLTVSDALRTQTVALTGTGLPPPSLAATPISLAFPSQPIGTSSAPALLTIRNAGGAPMANIGFAFSGASPASFATGATTCGTILPDGSTCTVQVIFSPTSSGAAAAVLTISSSTLGVKAVQVGVTGTGIAPNGINISPTTMAFTVSALGQTSLAQTATITNAGSAPANSLSISIAAPFGIAQNSCGSSLGPGAACSFGVVFTPISNGAFSGALTIASSLNSAVEMLSGIGGAAGSVQFQPSLLSFSTTGVSLSSGIQTVTVANTGPVSLDSLALSASNGFQIANTTCPTSLAAGASCAAGVVFHPSSAGPQSGTLTLTSGSLPEPTQAALAGLGFDFSVAALGATSQTIANGQTAAFTLVLTPLNGSSGLFSVACNALPANMACTFNPPSETVAANSSGNLVVQVATGRAASTSSRAAFRSHLLPLLCGVVLLPFLATRRKRFLALGILCCVLAMGVSSCSGSGEGPVDGELAGGSGSPNTPAGTYSIPVAVSSNGVVHNLTLTLTVD